MFRLKKQQLFFPIAAILATAGVVFFVSYGSSQVTNRAVLDISLSSDNYESSTRTFSDRSGLNHGAISSAVAVFVGGKYGGVEGAMDFSGGSKYVRVTGNGINAGSWNYPEASFVMWIRPRSVSSTSDQNIVTIENTFEIAINNRNNGFSSVKYASMPWAWRGNSGDNVKNDEWNQIVYTHSSTARKVYVNGEVVYTSSETGNLAAGTASYPYLTIGGRYSGTSAPFDGLIEGVKILNYVLSDEEVRNLYDSGRSVAGLSPVASGGLVGHWSMDRDRYVEGTENLLYDNGIINWTVGGLTTPVSRTTVVENNRYKINSGSSSGAFRLYIPITKLISGETYTLSYKYKINTGTQFRMNDWCDTSLFNKVDIGNGSTDSYSAASGVRATYDGTYRFMDFYITADTEVEIWDVQLEKKDHATPFTIGTRTSRLTDLSPYSNHGDTGLEQSFVFTEDRLGKEGGAMSFNGIDNFIKVPSISLGTNITLSLWFNKMDTTKTFTPMLEQGGTRRFRLIRYNNRICFGNDSSTDNFYCTADAFSSEDFWYHVAASFNGAYHIFVNGVEYPLIQSTGNYASWVTNQLNIGYRPYTSIVGSFNGAIDDVRIYNRALSESEIKSLYNSYNPKTTTGTLQQGLVLDMPLKLDYTKNETAGSEIMTDRTPYSNDGQNYGATITSDGASFDGVSNFIQIGESDVLDITKSITISFWYKIPELNVTQRLITKKVGGGTFGLGYETSFYNTNRFLTVYNNGDNRIYLYSDYINNPDDVGKYFHYTYVYNYEEGYQRAFINGEEFSGVGSFTAGYEAGSTAGAVLDIGRRDLEEAKGVLSNILIYNRALSGDEIKTLYDRGRSDAGIIFTPKN